MHGLLDCIDDGMDDIFQECVEARSQKSGAPYKFRNSDNDGANNDFSISSSISSSSISRFPAPLSLASEPRKSLVESNTAPEVDLRVDEFQGRNEEEVEEEMSSRDVEVELIQSPSRISNDPPSEFTAAADENTPIFNRPSDQSDSIIAEYSRKEFTCGSWLSGCFRCGVTPPADLLSGIWKYPDELRTIQWLGDRCKPGHSSVCHVEGMLLYIVDIKHSGGGYTNIRFCDPSGWIEGTMHEPLPSHHYPAGITAGATLLLHNVSPHVCDTVRLTILPTVIKRVFPASSSVPQHSPYAGFARKGPQAQA